MQGLCRAHSRDRRSGDPWQEIPEALPLPFPSSPSLPQPKALFLTLGAQGSKVRDSGKRSFSAAGCPSIIFIIGFDFASLMSQEVLEQFLLREQQRAALCVPAPGWNPALSISRPVTAQINPTAAPFRVNQKIKPFD